MAYILTHTDGSTFMTLGEGVVDQRLGISLIGQNVHNYGQFIADNFIRLLENQSNIVPPPNPISGQLWWDSKNKALHYFDGDRFKACSTTAISDAPPNKPKNGDQWWDISTGQLKIAHETDWITIGPVNPLGAHFTGISQLTVSDTNGRQHSIATVVVDGEVISIANKDEQFTLSVPINGITEVAIGVTLAPTASLYGTSSNALKLGGVVAANYVRTTDTLTVLQGSLVIEHENGLAIGDAADPLQLYNGTSAHTISSDSTNISVAVGTTSLVLNGVDNTITLTAEPTIPKSAVTKRYVDTELEIVNDEIVAYVDSQVLAFSGNAVLSSLEMLSSAINNDPNYHINVTAALNLKANIASPIFTGVPQSPTVTNIADSSNKIATTAFVKNALASGLTNISTVAGLTVGGDILPSVTDTFNIGSPSLKFKNVYGTAMRANYADLAENYLSDSYYLPGTVVIFGGDNEITVSSTKADTRVAGIISVNPAYLMNDTYAAGYQPVALTGKVPCLVNGPITKGDLIINSTIAGVAQRLDNASQWAPGCVIGKSLESNTEEGVRLITVAVGRF